MHCARLWLSYNPSLTPGAPLASLSRSLSSLDSVPPSTDPASIAAGRTFIVLFKS